MSVHYSQQAVYKRSYDIGLLGCTGFTGQLVAAYFAHVLAPRYPDLRFALLGRSEGKLLQLKNKLVAGALALKHTVNCEVLVVNALDYDSLNHAVGLCSVILSTAGPFRKIGLPVVEACVRLGTNYLDINGETLFMRDVISLHHGIAKSKGCVLVPACGFDSIPSDLGAYVAAQNLSKKSGHAVRKVRSYVRMQGGMSGGTVASILGSGSKADRIRANNPYLLTDDSKNLALAHRAEDADISLAEKHNDSIKRWVGAFTMSKINTRVVRRSVELSKTGKYTAFPTLSTAYSYNEFQVAQSKQQAEKLVRSINAPPEAIKKLVDAGRLPHPGQGPDEKTRAKSWFEFVVVAETIMGDRETITVSGGDPGYTETAKMVSEAAILLALHRDELPCAKVGGSLTPSTAFGDHLVQVLHREGISFKSHGNQCPAKVLTACEQAHSAPKARM